MNKSIFIHIYSHFKVNLEKVLNFYVNRCE